MPHHDLLSPYQQNDRAAMGSPLSPIVTNSFMKHLEEIAMQTANKTPSMWIRYVDDTFSLWPHGPEELSLFLKHINHPSSLPWR